MGPVDVLFDHTAVLKSPEASLFHLCYMETESNKGDLCLQDLCCFECYDGIVHVCWQV